MCIAAYQAESLMNKYCWEAGKDKAEKPQYHLDLLDLR
jgi:hypothetical protein